MHGQAGCPESNQILAGDAWLEQHLPPLISFAEANDGVIFITWDEGDKDKLIPFLAIGPYVKPGYASALRNDHRSMVKSVELLLGLPVLASVETARTLADLFVEGAFP
jgi:phosphatidylinositol-3-phosphatase